MIESDLKTNAGELLDKCRIWTPNEDKINTAILFKKVPVKVVGINWEDLPKILGFDPGKVKETGDLWIMYKTPWQEKRTVSRRILWKQETSTTEIQHQAAYSFLFKVHSYSELINWNFQLTFPYPRPMIEGYELYAGSKQGSKPKPASERVIVQFTKLAASARNYLEKGNNFQSSSG